MQYRSFQPGDTESLVEIIGRAMPADPVSADWFTEYVLLDPLFDPDGLIIATTADGVPAGFVYAVRGRAGAPVPVDPAGGWLTVGAVDPVFQRRGVGTELTRRAVAFLSSRGARYAVVAGYPPAYFAPGVDAEAYPAAAAVLERSGFRVVSHPVAMDRSLATYGPSDESRARLADLVSEGYTIGPATAGDLPAVIGFAAREFAPDWGEAIRAAAVRFGRPDRVLQARDAGGAVVGFATYAAYRGQVERFGPFGVVATQRGRGLGGVVLAMTLARMRSEGARSAWFLWTGEHSPAGRLYARTGFAVTRRFQVMRMDLTDL